MQVITYLRLLNQSSDVRAQDITRGCIYRKRGNEILRWGLVVTLIAHMY